VTGRHGDQGPSADRKAQAHGNQTLREAVASGRDTLSGHSVSPRLDAELLLCEALGVPRAHLYAHPEVTLDPEPARRYRGLIARRARGESVAVLRGCREFWSLDLVIRPGVLVSRAETELLVETALERLGADPAQVVDLGTGSGAIALALASERPGWSLTATDRSPAALDLARHNAQHLGIPGIQWVLGEWLHPFREAAFDLIVSNPPYIAPGDPELEAAVLDHEPRSALLCADHGLEAIHAIVTGAPRILRPGGYLMVEHGHRQGPQVRALFEQAGLQRVETLRDLGDRERMSLGTRRT